MTRMCLAKNPESENLKAISQEGLRDGIRMDSTEKARVSTHLLISSFLALRFAARTFSALRGAQNA